MKIAAFEIREWEERDFRNADDSGKYELRLDNGPLTAEAAETLDGFDAVSVLDSILDGNVLDILKRKGVRFITTRTIGYDRIDVAYAKSLGIRVANASYPPDGVAEFAIMLMLLCLRRYKASLYRVATNDYSLRGLTGRELGKMTVGVVGTGGIGGAVIRAAGRIRQQDFGLREKSKCGTGRLRGLRRAGCVVPGKRPDNIPCASD